MTLADDYARQYQWRSWEQILQALPDLDGQLVLDLGCATGDLSRDLALRGAYVIGVDANEELVNYGRQRGLKNVEFRIADIRAFRDPDLFARRAQAKRPRGMRRWQRRRSGRELPKSRWSGVTNMTGNRVFGTGR